MRTLIVVPTYLEAENIEEMLDRVRAAVPDADVVVVDDGSPDGTADLATAKGSELGQIEVIRRSAKGGLGAAYRVGFRWGLERGYDVLVEIDADLSHDPDALPTLLGTLDRGADLVIGSRYVPGGSVPGWPAHRRALSRWGNRYSGFVLGMGVRDATSGYRAYRRSALEGAHYDATSATGYAFQIELAYRIARRGNSVVEIPIVFVDRTRGKSKMSPRIAVEAIGLVTWWALRDRVLRRGSRASRL